MNCVDLLDNLNLRCQPIPLVGSPDPGFIINTPFTFEGGACLNLFVIPEAGNTLILTDDGDTLAHLHALGHYLDAPGLPVFLRNLAAHEGLQLEDDGAITGTYKLSEFSAGFAAFAQLVAGVRAWEREQAGLTEADESFVATVEEHLRAWKPNRPLSRGAKAIGASKRTITFDLEWDGRLVDAVSPSPQTTGARLRKILDVKNGFDERSTLVIVDDRFDKIAAASEADIYQAVTDVMLFSRLLARSNHAPQDLH